MKDPIVRDLFRLLTVMGVMIGCTGTTAVQAQLILAKDGQPQVMIVLENQPTRAAQFAAWELQWHLRQMTGGDFPIVREDAPMQGAAILIGNSERVRALGIDPTQFAPQEYLIRATPDALILVGRDQDDRGEVFYSQRPGQRELDSWPSVWDAQGTLYAVYDFLERCCGVRWFTPTEFGTDCPSQPSLVIADLQVRRSPFMCYRFAAYPSSENYDQYTGLWPYGSEGKRIWEAAAYPELQSQRTGDEYTVAKRGWNTLFRLRHREGGEPCYGNHSLYGYYRRFWEAEKGQEQLFEKRHEDWFAQGYAGQPPQMCYTSRGLVEQVAKDACEFFDTGKSYPGAQAVGDYFCVEPMDNAQFCKCDNCQKWLTGQDADSPFFTNGRHSEYFFQFVNEVAKLVGKRHPNKRVVCLAYMTHGTPPKSFRLEPNVLVQYCFACNRLNFDRPSYTHEIDLLRQWRSGYPDRDMYLWLYYTFPVEIAINGNFHCFPGFFADAMCQQFQMFKDLNYRGVFHCGYGQELEAYLTYCLMDDPQRDTEALMREYFARYFGAAAQPMREFYELVEQTYGDPANYPEAIASGRTEGHHHQTEEVAWGYLGNASRMAKLSALMAQANEAADTVLHKQRVKLFELGVWNYMLAGRQQYLEHAKARSGDAVSALRVPYSSSGPVHGQVGEVDFAESLALTRWRSRIAEPTRRHVAAGVLHDGEYLYLQCEDRGEREEVAAKGDVQSGDYWQVLFSRDKDRVTHQFLLSAAGNGARGNVSTNMPIHVLRSPGAYRLQFAIPLSQLGWTSGEPCYLNIVRRSPNTDDEPMWSPSFAQFDDPAGLRQITLDAADTLPIDALHDAGNTSEDQRGLIARFQCDEGQASQVRSTVGSFTGTLSSATMWDNTSKQPVLRFQDSRQQYVDLGDLDPWDLTGPLTLAMWIQYESSETWYPGLLGKGYELAGTYGLHLRQGGTVWFEIDAPDSTRHIHNPTDRCVTPGQWCHVAATYDGKAMRVFVNGREAGAAKEVVTSIRTNSEPLRFGWLGSYGHFNGCVRDIRIYNRGLSHAEIYAQYLSGRGKSGR